MTGGARSIVVGAGIRGLTAALELRQRGWTVSLFDPGPLPHPDAASTDVSKPVRMDHGSDALYTELMETAFPGWDEWNRIWRSPPYHQDGFLLMSRAPIRPGGLRARQLHGARPARPSGRADRSAGAEGTLPRLERRWIPRRLLEPAGRLGRER